MEKGFFDGIHANEDCFLLRGQFDDVGRFAGAGDSRAKTETARAL
jgi:hypothetical protein